MLSHPEVRTYWYDRVRDALEFTPPEGFFPRSIAKHLADFTISEGCVEAHAPSGETIRCRVTPATEEEKERFAQKLADTPDLLSDWLEGNLRPSHADLAEAAGIPFLSPFHAETPNEAALWTLTADETGGDPEGLFRLYGIDPASLSHAIGTDYLQLTASKAPTLSEVVSSLAAEDAMGALPGRAEAERFLHAVPYALLENHPDDFLTLLPEDMPLAKSKNFRKRFRRDFRKVRDRVEDVLRAVAEENARRKESFAEAEAPAADSGDAAAAAKARFVSLLGYPEGLLLSVRLTTTVDPLGADLRRKPVERLFARARFLLTNAEYEALERPVTPAREAAALLALTNAETEALTRDIESRRAVVRAAARLILSGQIRPILYRAAGIEHPAPRLLWVPALQNDGVKAVFQTLSAALTYRTADLVAPETLASAGFAAPEFPEESSEDFAESSSEASSAPARTEVSAAENERRVRTVVLLALSDAIKALFAVHSGDIEKANLPTALLLGEDTSVLDGLLTDRPMKLLLAAFRPFQLASLYPWMPALTLTRLAKGRTELTFGILSREASHRELKFDAESRKKEEELHEKGEFGSSPVPYSLLLALPCWQTHRYAAASALAALVKALPALSSLLNGRGTMTLEPAFLKTFFTEIAPQIAWLGVPLVLPGKLRGLLRPRLIARVGTIPGGGVGSFLTRETLGEFRWEVAIGSRTMTLEELRRLMDEVGNVIPIDDEFVFLDPKLLDDMEEIAKKSSDPFERLRATLTGEWRGAQVLADENLRERMRVLTDIKDLPVPTGLRAELRPYQHRGYSWLMKNLRLGFGGLIADDMGLGKTLQAIAAMTALKESGELAEKKILCVLPMGVLTNWAREIERFSPSLTVGLYHGLDRAMPENLPDVTLTSYGTLRRDVEVLKSRRWRLVVLDEAQAVKNPAAAQSSAVRSLTADAVIAMTGTPVENRLMEYWSILSVVMPGLLGTATDFQREYATPIEIDHDPARLEAFRRLTAPFMIRRVKSDKSIIRDLPEKNVIDRFTSITKEQAALYAKTLDESMRKLRGEDRSMTLAQRRGIVLTLIMKLKQICNSPSQFLGTRTEKPDAGKGVALLEILSECRESDRKVLIFTQFREMGERLQEWIAKATGERPDFLHGGVTRERRARMTDRFQNDRTVRTMIVSLKAGGTGLNLTAASAVVHYDLWWNPAVEDQATDRAHRIGQRRDVLVYRFISAGTFEERVNELLTQKRRLTDLTVHSGENWLGDLSNDELDQLFRLSL